MLTHTVEVGGERGGHMQQCSADIIHPVFICVSRAHRSPYWWAWQCVESLCLHGFTHTCTNTQEPTRKCMIEAIWPLLILFSLLFLRLISWTSEMHYLDDWVIQRKEGGWEGENGGREQVILESLNCNHHLQLLPPRCSDWTSTEGESKEGRTERETMALQRNKKHSCTKSMSCLLLACISMYHFITWNAF